MLGPPLVKLKKRKTSIVELAVAYNKLAPGISAILTSKTREYI
jgi:hypothetical protein